MMMEETTQTAVRGRRHVLVVRVQSGRRRPRANC